MLLSPLTFRRRVSHQTQGPPSNPSRLRRGYDEAPRGAPLSCRISVVREPGVRQSTARKPVPLPYRCQWSHDWQRGGPTTGLAADSCCIPLIHKVIQYLDHVGRAGWPTPVPGEWTVGLQQNSLSRKMREQYNRLLRSDHGRATTTSASSSLRGWLLAATHDSVAELNLTPRRSPPATSRSSLHCPARPARCGVAAATHRPRSTPRTGDALLSDLRTGLLPRRCGGAVLIDVEEFANQSAEEAPVL
jgi:hypothetical protein